MENDPNQVLFDLHLAHAVDAVRTAEGEGAKAAYALLLLSVQLDDLVRRSDLQNYKRAAARQRAQEKLIDEIGTAIGLAYNLLLNDLRADFQRIGAAEAVWQGNALSAALGAPVPVKVPAIKQIVANVYTHGARLADWLRRGSADLAHRAAAAVRVTVAGGGDDAALAAAVSGAKSGKIETLLSADDKPATAPAREGGAVATARRDAVTIARSAALATIHAVAAEVQAAAAAVGLLRGKRWCAVLDARTTTRCRSLNGACWDFKDNPLPESANKRAWPGHPPIHFHCRSSVVPMIGSWRHLVRALGDDHPLLKQIPPLTRGSLRGTLPPDVTFAGWLRRQPAVAQKEILGAARWRLWQRGKVKDEELATWAGQVLTVAEFERRCRELKGGG